MVALIITTEIAHAMNTRMAQPRNCGEAPI